MKPIVQLIPLVSVETFQQVFFALDHEAQTLRDLLRAAPALSYGEALDPKHLDQLLCRLRISPMTAGVDGPGYRIESVALQLAGSAAPVANAEPAPASAATAPGVAPSATGPAAAEAPPAVPSQRQGKLASDAAVKIAYAREIDTAASFLDSGLSVLVYCDKIVAQPLWQAIVRKARREARELMASTEDGTGLMPRSLQQRQLAMLRQEMGALKSGQVLVLPHLDLLVGSSDGNLGNDGRELTELLYTHPDRLILAFADRSLTIPEVLASRFAVRELISGVSRTVIDTDGTERLLGEVFVTADEAARFEGFDAGGLYKNVAGMNPMQILDAVSYAVKEVPVDRPAPVDKLYRAIRAFKVQNSAATFEVPNVSFDDIGGYVDVKALLQRALNLMAGNYRLPDEALRKELIPRGFIFYGPPGTGKTLFAKAIANKLNATVQVVSGPEVMDMYVGESERKLREFFAEARRNAPAVLVFDEFDAIAAKRTGRDDGGSRAGNAVVAQLLTEMDGFRADVPMLVIGTTNRIELIDEALLRPSRFQAIPIGLPDRTARYSVADVHARHFKLRDRVSDGLLAAIADATQGFNGDQIRSLFRDAYVGLHTQDPPKQADAYRFGELIGRLRHDEEVRNINASSQESRSPAAAGTATRATNDTAATDAFQDL